MQYSLFLTKDFKIFGIKENKEEKIEVSQKELEKKLLGLVESYTENKIKQSDVKELEDLLNNKRKAGKIESKYDAILSKIEYDKIKETCKDDYSEYKYKFDKNLGYYIVYKKTNDYEAKRYSVKKEEFLKNYIH